jgi:hypothetical protein
MPPAIVPLALVALGVPAALRAILGRPRTLGSAWLAAAAAAAIAQVAGEILGLRIGVLGDAQLLLAGVLATLTSALVALLERRER